MTTVLREGALKFVFDDNMIASKYDDWAFYRNQFQNGCFRGNKAVDLLCCSGNDAWLIEVKDYRQHPRTKAAELADEIAIKVRDSLAGLVAAQTQANDRGERRFARNLLKTRVIRVVCHIEQPTKASRLRPRAIEPDKLKDQLRRLVKAVDPHPIIMDKNVAASAVPWCVADDRGMA